MRLKGNMNLQNCVNLGYLASSSNFLPTVRDNPSEPSSGVKNTKERNTFGFDIQINLHRDICLQKKPTRCTINFILVKNSACFGQTYCPSSGVLILLSQ